MVLLQQMIALFLMMLVGYVCAKMGVLDAMASKKISWLVVNVGNPAMILAAGMDNEIPVAPEKLMLVVVLAVIIYAAYLEEINKNTGLNSLREKHRAQGFIPPLAKNRVEFGTMEFTIADTSEREGRWSYSDKRDVERTLKGIKEALYTCEAVVVMIHSHEIKADQEKERHEKNLPYVADEKEALAILAYLNRACRPYGVEWCYNDGIMIRSK